MNFLVSTEAKFRGILPDFRTGSNRKFVASEVVRDSTQEFSESSTQTTQSGALITDTVLTLGKSPVDDIRGSGADVVGVRVSGESSGEFGAHASGTADGIGTKGVRVSVTGKGVRDSTEEITESSTQLTAQTSSALAIQQPVPQSGSLITDTAFTFEGDFTRGPERGGVGIQVSGESSGQLVSQVSGVVGGESVRESATGEIMRNSTKEITRSATLHDTHTFTDVGAATLTKRIPVQSPAQFGARAGKVVDSVILPERGAAAETVIGETVREFARKTQTSMRRISQTSESDVATSNVTLFDETSSRYGGQRAAEHVDVTVIRGNTSVGEALRGEALRESTQEVTRSSTLRTSQIQSSTELDVATSSNTIAFTKSSGQFGNQVAGYVDATGHSEKGYVSEFGTGEVVKASPQGVTDPSTLQITQSFAELDVAASTDSGVFTESSRNRDQKAEEVVDATMLVGTYVGEYFTGEIVQDTRQETKVSSTLETTRGSSEEITDITVLPGRSGVREVVTGGILRKSTSMAEIAESSELLTAQISGEVDIATSIHTATFFESAGLHGARGVDEVVDIMVLPGRGGGRESATSETVRASTQQIIESSTQQTKQPSTEPDVATSSHGLKFAGGRVTGEAVDITVLNGRGHGGVGVGETLRESTTSQEITASSTVQTAQKSTESNVATSSSAVTFSGSSSTYDSRGAEKVDVTMLNGGGGFREPITGNILNSSQENQLSMQASTKVSIAPSNNAVTLTSSSGQLKGHAFEEVDVVKTLRERGSVDVRRSVIGEIMRESTSSQEKHSSTQLTTQTSTEVDVAKSTNYVTFAQSENQYGTREAEKIVGVTNLLGRRAGEVRKPASSQQTTQTSTGLDVTTSSTTVRVAESSDQYGGRGDGKAIAVTVLPGGGGARESVAGEVMRESTSSQEVTESSTVQTMHTSSELNALISSNAVKLVEPSGTHGGWGDEALVTVLPGRESVRRSATGETVRESTEESTKSSTLQTTQVSAGLDLATSSSGVTFAESSRERSGRGDREIGDVGFFRGMGTTRTVGVGDIVHNATEEINQSPTLQATQTASELEITQQTITSASLTTDTVQAVGERTLLHERGARGMLAVGELSGQLRCHVLGDIADAAGTEVARRSITDEVVQESSQEITQSSTQQTKQTSTGVEVTMSSHTVTFAELSGTDGNEVAREAVETTMFPGGEAGDIRKVVQESTQETTESSTLQTTQMSSELSISTQTTQSTTDNVMTTDENTVDYVRLRGKDASGRPVAGESSGHY
jgi:hypothetical protein